MKLEKISLIGHAIEMTKLARGPVAQMPPVTADASGNVILSAAQELENRTCFRVFTEFYDALQRATDDETVFHDPLDEATVAAARAASPAGTAATIAQAVAAAVPTTSPAAAVAATAATALAAVLSKPLGS